MKLESTRDLGAPQQRVWSLLNDLDVLARCIPGCESLTRSDDGSLEAVVLAKVGPVSARFKGRVSFEDVVEPHSYRLVFAGQGGAAGFAKGEARVKLEPIGTGTRLSYLAESTVGGKLAQIGSRLIDASAKKLSEEFFDRFQGETATSIPSSCSQSAVAPVVGDARSTVESVDRAGFRSTIKTRSMVGVLGLVAALTIALLLVSFLR